ncbi:DUF421 domain-containing protein [Microbacteriaceae bacterium 4G12]
MHIFKGAVHITISEWVVRAIVAYLFLMIVAKVMGQRSISQLHFLDVVLALLLGGNLSNPLSDERLDLTGAMTTTLVLVILHVISSFLGLKWELWRKFLEPNPLLLVKNGEIQLRNLRRARISIDYLLSELRLQNIEDIQKVAIALWEPGGNISAFVQTEHQSFTKKDGKLNVEPFAMPIVVIKEGKIWKDGLASLGKTETWLRQQVIEQPIANILLATVDRNDEVHLILKK